MATRKSDDALLIAMVQAVVKHGTITQAAIALDQPRGTLSSRISDARRRNLCPELFAEIDRPKYIIKGESIFRGPDGEERGRWEKTKLAGREDEEVHHVPDPKKITKISTQYDQVGKVTQQWIAESPDAARREELWRAFGEELKADLPRVKPQKAPAGTDADLMACYPVGDHHMGMLAWAIETGGDNYDIAIAEQLLDDAFRHLTAAAPKCGLALIAFLGDFMHYDSWAAVTPAHKNLLDADGRFPKMVRAAIRSMRRSVDYALARHDRVHVIIEPGNHDPASSIFLMESLALFYEREPRVTIDTSPSRYHYFTFGKVMIGTHHGDGTKPENLPGIMAADRPEEWGRTEFRYILTGHVHSRTARDFPGCTWESMRVLAPLDGWAAQKGYRSIRDMRAIIMHREYGEVSRLTVNPKMFASAA